MFGIGWTEMLVIGVVALIVIGPKDLPVVMARIGKIVGQVRRMGNEFQREISKTTGLDEIRNLRSSITEPLRKTTEDIRREFNAMTPTGVKPSGIIKPADPKAESVVNEIHAAAGIAPPAVMAPIVAKKAPRKAPAKARAVPASTVAMTDLAPVEAEKPVAETAVAKPAARKAPAKAAAPPVAVAPPAKTSAKAAAKKLTATAKAATPKKTPTKKPAAKAGDA